MRRGAVLLALAAAGCQQMAITWFHLTGGDTVEARYKLSDGKLAIVIDDPQGLVVVPGTFRILHEQLEQRFTANGIKSKVVAFEDWNRLRLSDPLYDKMSRREIGEKVGADQVLYLNVTDFRLKREPAAPLFQGRFALRVSVYSTERKRDVRLWPDTSEGEEVVAETKPAPADEKENTSDIARQLAIEMSDKVAKLFYAHKEKD